MVAYIQRFVLCFVLEIVLCRLLKSTDISVAGYWQCEAVALCSNHANTLGLLGLALMLIHWSAKSKGWADCHDV